MIEFFERCPPEPDWPLETQAADLEELIRRSGLLPQVDTSGEALAVFTELNRRDQTIPGVVVRLADCMLGWGQTKDACVLLITARGPVNTVRKNRLKDAMERRRKREAAQQSLSAGTIRQDIADSRALDDKRLWAFEREAYHLLIDEYHGQRASDWAGLGGVCRHFESPQLKTRALDLTRFHATRAYKQSYRLDCSVHTNNACHTGFAGVQRDYDRLVEAEGLLNQVLDVHPNDCHALLGKAAVLQDWGKHHRPLKRLPEARALLNRAYAAGCRGPEITRAYRRQDRLDGGRG